MIYKVHWIVDGIAEIEADSKEDAEKKLQESLEDYVKKSKPLMDKFLQNLSKEQHTFLEMKKMDKKDDDKEKN